jgi:hypothetical protein
MGTQNYSNHTRYPYRSNRYAPLSMTLIFLAAMLNVYDPLLLAGKLWAIVIVALSFSMISMWYSIRYMVIRVQDRAIRAEENFRHYLLTGKPLAPELSAGQIVALRFASDSEFPELAKRSVLEKLSRKAIKKAIHQWRPDLNRA